MTKPELSVIVPTRDRERLLLPCAQAIEAGARDLSVELIIVDDGSRDRTLAIAREFSAASEVTTTVLSQIARGPAAARNLGIARASGTACLFVGDDVIVSPAAVHRHLEFHKKCTHESAALLGKVIPTRSLSHSELIRWLHEDGTQFAYGRLHPWAPVPPQHFWTANVSAKTELLRRVGGFDEEFTDAACEDAELGIRLGRAGMTLRYDPEAVAEHDHPTDLASTLARMHRVGRAMRVLAAKAPELPQPRPPSARHRAKSAALALPAALHVPSKSLRRATWRFLCEEVTREEVWGFGGDGDIRPKIGRRLATLAIRAQH